MLRHLPLVGLLIAFPPSSSSGQAPPSAPAGSAVLSGRVVDRTDAVLAGATVSLKSLKKKTPGPQTWLLSTTGGDSAERSVTADASGAFRFDGLDPGTYEVAGHSPGFATARLSLSLAEGEHRRVILALELNALTEDVVVRSKQITGGVEALRHVPGSADIVDRKTLEDSRVFTTNEALRKIPGLNVRDEEGLGLRPNVGLRGLNPTRSSKVLLLEDGIPLAYAPYGDNSSYYHPPIERFESIEVLKGSGQVAYGPTTVGGIINYITPAPPPTPGGSILLRGGNRAFLDAQGSYGATAGRTGFLFDFMRKQGEGSREHTRSELNDLNAKLVASLGASHSLTLRANYYGEDSNVTYSGLTEDEYRANPRRNSFRNDFFYGDRYGASATHIYALAPDRLLTTSVYGAAFTRHWWRQSSHSGQRPNDSADPGCGGMANLHTTCGNEGRLRRYGTWGVEPRLRFDHALLGARSQAEIGGRAHVETQDRLQKNGETARARDGRLVEDNLRQNRAYSGFLQNRVMLGRWTLTPGLRVERVRFARTNRLARQGAGVSGDATLTQVIPGFGVAYNPTDSVTIFTGLHRGFAPPRTEDVITNSGGVINLDAELSWNYELGLRSTMRPGLQVTATAFRMDYQNQIVPASLAGGVGATLTNGGETLHQGLEASGRLEVGTLRQANHNPYLRVAYTFIPVAGFTGIRFSGVDGFRDVSVSGNRLPYAPRHQLALTLGYAHPGGLDALVEAVGVGPQFGDDLNTIVATPDGQRGLLPGYTVWNASVSWTTAPRLTFFVTVKNLLDDTFIVDRARGILPGSPRLLHVGLKVRY